VQIDGTRNDPQGSKPNTRKNTQIKQKKTKQNKTKQKEVKTRTQAGQKAEADTEALAAGLLLTYGP